MSYIYINVCAPANNVGARWRTALRLVQHLRDTAALINYVSGCFTTKTSWDPKRRPWPEGAYETACPSQQSTSILAFGS